jgi:hypothetical protein
LKERWKGNSRELLLSVEGMELESGQLMEFQKEGHWDRATVSRWGLQWEFQKGGHWEKWMAPCYRLEWAFQKERQRATPQRMVARWELEWESQKEIHWDGRMENSMEIATLYLILFVCRREVIPVVLSRLGARGAPLYPL